MLSFLLFVTLCHICFQRKHFWGLAGVRGRGNMLRREIFALCFPVFRVLDLLQLSCRNSPKKKLHARNVVFFSLHLFSSSRRSGFFFQVAAEHKIVHCEEVFILACSCFTVLCSVGFHPPASPGPCPVGASGVAAGPYRCSGSTPPPTPRRLTGLGFFQVLDF